MAPMLGPPVSRSRIWDSVPRMASNIFRASRPDIVSVLTVDRELAARLDGTRRERAESLSAARLLRRPAGSWNAKHDAAQGRDGLGLLVIEGTLVRRVG